MLGLITQGLHILASLAGAFWLLLTRYPRTSHRSGGAYIELTKSPNQLAASDIIALIVLAFTKYIPGLSPSLRAEGGSQTFLLPQIRAEGLLRIREQDVRIFRESVLPNQDPSQSSTTNPFFLVAQSVPLIIYFLVNRTCPIRPFGAVNTRNVIHILQSSTCRDAEFLQQASEQSRLTYISSIGGPESPGLRRKRGVEFCITIEIYLDNDLLMQQQCWFLQFLPSSFEPKYIPPKEDQPADEQSKQDSIKAEFSLQMTLQDALRWAASSKDYDGIHVSPLVARLFGFTGVLAHGNHVAALAIQQLQSLSANSSKLLSSDQGDTTADEAARASPNRVLWGSDRPLTVDINFIRPAILPAILAVQWHSRGHQASTAELTVLRHGKVCMQGSCTINE